jgi:hypothetical protein
MSLRIHWRLFGRVVPFRLDVDSNRAILPLHRSGRHFGQSNSGEEGKDWSDRTMTDRSVAPVHLIRRGANPGEEGQVLGGDCEPGFSTETESKERVRIPRGESVSRVYSITTVVRFQISVFCWVSHES